MGNVIGGMAWPVLCYVLWAQADARTFSGNADKRVCCGARTLFGKTQIWKRGQGCGATGTF